MKVYLEVVMDASGKVLFEKSYEYRGEIALMKGADTSAMEEQGRKSYELQLEEFEFQKSLLMETQRKQQEEELRKKIAIEKTLQRTRTGSQQTILTGGEGLGGAITKKTLFA